MIQLNIFKYQKRCSELLDEPEAEIDVTRNQVGDIIAFSSMDVKLHSSNFLEFHQCSEKED